MKVRFVTTKKKAGCNLQLAKEGVLCTPSFLFLIPLLGAEYDEFAQSKQKLAN